MNILIQGGGRGIGLALARRALAAGAERLVVTARDPGNSAGPGIPNVVTMSGAAVA